MSPVMSRQVSRSRQRVRHEARHDDGSPTVTLVGVEVLA
jgi:hypothetical protein